MTIDDSKLTKKSLVELNQQIAEKEQEGEAARGFFERHLSDQLVFRRANGDVVNKQDFLAGLKKNPFSKREPEEIDVMLLDNRALVTLIIVGTRADNGSIHRYRNIRLFTRAADQWLLEFWYNYELTGL